MRTVRIVVLMGGILSGVVVMVIHHEIGSASWSVFSSDQNPLSTTIRSRTPIPDQTFIMPEPHDSADEEARNSSPAQERVIERPAFIDTTRISWDAGAIPAEHTGDVG